MPASRRLQFILWRKQWATKVRVALIFPMEWPVRALSGASPESPLASFSRKSASFEFSRSTSSSASRFCIRLGAEFFSNRTHFLRSLSEDVASLDASSHRNSSLIAAYLSHNDRVALRICSRKEDPQKRTFSELHSRLLDWRRVREPFQMDYISSFDIRLAKEIFYAGERISGSVLLENNENIKIKGPCPFRGYAAPCRLWLAGLDEAHFGVYSCSNRFPSRWMPLVKRGGLDRADFRNSRTSPGEGPRYTEGGEVWRTADNQGRPVCAGWEAGHLGKRYCSHSCCLKDFKDFQKIAEVLTHEYFVVL